MPGVSETSFSSDVDGCVLVGVSVTTNREQTNDDRTDENISKLKYIQRANPRCLLLSLFSLGTLFLICGLFICGFWKNAFIHELAKKISLSSSNDSQTSKVWLSNSIPLYLKVYMFNWTNPHASLAGTEIPNFTERGPYIFRARVFKEGVVWNDNDTVSYIQRRRWDFVPEMSNGSLSDEVTSINVVAVALAYQLKNMPQFIVRVLNEAIKYRGIPLIVTKTVENQLFDGYDDGILSVLKIVGDLVNSNGILKTVADVKTFFSDVKSMLTFNSAAPIKDATPMSSQIIDKLQKLENIKDRFGWWYQKNLTETHHFNLHTGVRDANMLGEIHSWDFKTICRDNEKIQGSTGELWPMNVTSARTALLFIPDMCSSFDLINVGPTKVEGIDGIKFIGARETMGPSISRKPKTLVDEELLTGIRNITAIVKAPIFISFPHFYKANEIYKNSISGMQPDQEKHEFSLVLQKDSGVVLEGHGRIQINVMLEPSEDIELVGNVPPVLFPTIWFEQTAVIPPILWKQMKFGFVVVPHLLAATGIICIILGLILLVTGFVLVHLLYNSKPYRTALNYVKFSISKRNKVTITVQKPVKSTK